MRGLVRLALLIWFLLPVHGWAGQEKGTVATGIHSVQAEFTQEKHLKILSRPLVSRGRFVFQAPDSLRWEYREPIHSVLIMHQGRVRKFIRRNGTMIEEQGMDLSPMQVVMAEIGGWLEGRITETGTFSVQRLEQGTIRLVPKSRGVRAIITAIELQPGERPGLLKSVTIFEGRQDRTRLIFSRARINEPVDARSFEVP